MEVLRKRLNRQPSREAGTQGPSLQSPARAALLGSANPSCRTYRCRSPAAAENRPPRGTQHARPGRDLVAVTTKGKSYHPQECGHVDLRRAREAYPAVLQASPSKARPGWWPTYVMGLPCPHLHSGTPRWAYRSALPGLRPGGPRPRSRPSAARHSHHDDARQDTNFAIAHLWVALLGGLSMLGCLIWRCIAQPRRVLRPASRRAGGSERRVKFDTQEDAVRGTPLKASPVQAESLTTRHHRRRGKHPLVEPSGTSPVAAKARYPHGPRPW